MQDEPRSDRKPRYIGWLISLGGLGINGLIVLINLVASSNYTPKTTHDSLQNDFNAYKLQQATEMSKIREDQIRELGKIAQGISELNGKMQDNVRQDSELKDHEERIRDLNNRVRK